MVPPRTFRASRDDARLPYPGIARAGRRWTRSTATSSLCLQKAVRPLTIVAKHRMVRDDRYKLVYAPARTGVRWLLYDTVADPGEEVDVARAHPDVVARLQAALWAWMQRDTAMTERGGFLVPRDEAARAQATPELGLVRLDTEPAASP